MLMRLGCVVRALLIVAVTLAVGMTLWLHVESTLTKGKVANGFDNGKMKHMAVKHDRKSTAIFKNAQAPFQFKFQVCNGLTNQRIQLLDGTLVGLFLGAQIVLPKNIVFNGAQFVSVEDKNAKPLDQMFNMTNFENKIRKLYHDFWCRQKKSQAFKVWCTDVSLPAIQYDEGQGAVVEVTLGNDEWAAPNLMNFSEKTFKEIFKQIDINGHVWRIAVPCEFWFKVKVTERSPFWDEFWKIDDALEFNNEILEIGRGAKKRLLDLFGRMALEKAREQGYPIHPGLRQHGGYHVVHLRAEQDWHEHCKKWFSWRARRDNCLNNTYHIGNVLLSEGISPALPVYLATGLSESEVQGLYDMPSMNSFATVYTVVAKGMLGLPKDVGNDREFWAAVDYMFSQGAEWFVGNSISTFSALAMEVRVRRKRPILPYNGGAMALEVGGIVRPNALTMILPMRPDIKWVFTLPRNVQLHDFNYNSTIVAVKSATAKTSLIPVCITAEDPGSKMFVKLLSMGVRVIHHRPVWQEALESWFQENDVTLAQQDEFLAQLLRIDIPTLGFLDEFVLFTDLDVLFRRDLVWKNFLGNKHVKLRDTFMRHMLSSTFFSNYARRGRVGVPEHFAMSDSWNSKDAGQSSKGKGGDCGVMLMNLRKLSESYEEFLYFVKNKYLNQALRSSDVPYLCPHDAFYVGSKLPSSLTWKPYVSKTTNVVHFEGINCGVDTGHRRNSRSPSQLSRQKIEECLEIEVCRISYLSICEEYKEYLELK